MPEVWGVGAPQKPDSAADRHRVVFRPWPASVLEGRGRHDENLCRVRLPIAFARSALRCDTTTPSGHAAVAQRMGCRIREVACPKEQATGERAIKLPSPVALRGKASPWPALKSPAHPLLRGTLPRLCENSEAAEDDPVSGPR